MKKVFRKYGSYILLIILFIGVIFIINNTKKSYAITTGINTEGKISSSFKTNFNNNMVNYIGDAGASSEVKDNFIVPESLKTNGNKILYLFSKNLDIPASGQTFEMVTDSPSNPTTVTDRGLIYIISHGYNETNKVKTVFTNSTYKTSYGELTDAGKQQYVTQIAIWLYMYKYKDNFSSYCNVDNKDTLCNFYSSTDTAISLIDYSNVISIITKQANKTNYKWLNYILKLVEEAEVYKTKAAETPKLTSLNVEFTLSSDKKKITSNLVTPTSAKSNDNFMYYNVEIIDPNNYGTYLVNKNNNKITNLTNMSGSFKVVIPVGNDVTEMDLTSVIIKIYGIYTYDEGYSYRVTTSTSEDVNKHPKYSSTLLGYVPTNTIGISFKARNFTTFSKIKSNSKEPLAGATLNVINKSDGSKVAEWVSEEEPHSIFLENGEYKLCEIVAPDGYELSNECIEFTIEDGQQIKIITMENALMTVPDTGINNSKTLLIIGSIILLIGGGILIIFKRTKKDVTILM